MGPRHAGLGGMMGWARLVASMCLLSAVGAASSDPFAIPPRPLSYDASKDALYESFGEGETFYCGCPYGDKEVDLGACDLSARKNESRALRTEAEHVVPISWWKRERDSSCWDDDICRTSTGNDYGGRRCCRKLDPVFAAAEGDLHNLRLAVGEINGDRSNRPFGQVVGEKRPYGDACDIEVNFEVDKVEPPQSLRGDIARVHFYMIGVYGIQVPSSYLELLKQWHRADPVSDAERDYNDWVYEVQGNRNPYVE